MASATSTTSTSISPDTNSQISAPYHICWSNSLYYRETFETSISPDTNYPKSAPYYIYYINPPLLYYRETFETSISPFNSGSFSSQSSSSSKSRSSNSSAVSTTTWQKFSKPSVHLLCKRHNKEYLPEFVPSRQGPTEEYSNKFKQKNGTSSKFVPSRQDPSNWSKPCARRLQQSDPELPPTSH